MQATQRPVDFAFPKVGPVGILGRPLSGSSVAANPNVTNGRKAGTPLGDDFHDLQKIF